ncbi:class I SAM-dependent methyltransferase [Flagellimonas pelagia]|uniref:Class I SAM-dependent methyltransferase n=1 Tax=Flagellimonas pelagia TaxID=2306998 RepID=A0A3A1NRW0_9FLAO|nr:class I SAM-dependent methyltransferase [Allomuricauda maritima]RIV47579.1 class I SAM-dependent methyltransferase [Allomuricauda maritima]TXK01646.1 class I SAM-dependent methyltransferase [Allomuricauda maritima]
MESDWLNKWDTRFGKEEYAYGTRPNEYLKEKLVGLTPGNILFPAEGEGRNAVYAAKLGWNVSAFDISTEGRKKALKLADQNQVGIDYQIGELQMLGYQEEQFDAIALIYAHFPPQIRKGYHQLLSAYLKKGGILIFEAFSKTHLEYQLKNESVGGPRDLGSLFSTEEILSEFEGYEILELKETVIELNEGYGHIGKGSVVRFLGKKK